jgi:hypothetical protein
MPRPLRHQRRSPAGEGANSNLERAWGQKTVSEAKMGHPREFSENAAVDTAGDDRMTQER